MKNDKMFNAVYASSYNYDALSSVEAWPTSNTECSFFGESAEEIRKVAETAGALVSFVEVEDSNDDYEGDIDHEIAVLREQRLGW